MPGDDGLAKIALALLIVLSIVFAGLGMYEMSLIGDPATPDTLISDLEAEKAEIAAVKEKIAEVEAAIKVKDAEIKAEAEKVEVEVEQEARLKLDWEHFKTEKKVHSAWATKIDDTKNKVSEYLESGETSDPDGTMVREPYSYRDLTRRKDEQEQLNAQTISKLDSSIDESRNELTKANNRYTRRYENKRNERSRLETRLDQAKDELQKASRREPVDMRVSDDGRILATDLPSRQVVISLGSNQGVKRGMRFEVFRVHQGGRRSRKGFVDVRVLKPETATCIIIERDITLGRCPSCGYTADLPEESQCPYCTGAGEGLHIQRLSSSPKMTRLQMNENDPIISGDSIHNPFFAPGASMRFAVKGEPLSPSFKMESLLSSIRWHGGQIDAEIGAGTSVLLTGKWVIEETRRARELGIVVLHQSEVFNFMRK